MTICAPTANSQAATDPRAKKEIIEEILKDHSELFHALADYERLNPPPPLTEKLPEPLR